MRCMRLAGNAGPKKSPKIHHPGTCTITQLCRAISSKLRHISTIEKSLLNSNFSPTRSHNMVNFGPLAAEICWRVWGTTPHFNGFRVLAALLHGTLNPPLVPKMRKLLQVSWRCDIFTIPEPICAFLEPDSNIMISLLGPLCRSYMR